MTYDYNKIISAYLSRTGFKSIDPRAALIDMDGTLYDSMPNHARAWTQLATEEGLETDYNDFFRYEGRTGASTISILYRNKYGCDPTPEYCARLYKRKTELFNTMPRVSAMPGAADLLIQLKERGLECILVTGSGQSSLLNRIPTDYPDIFTPGKRITSADVTHGKPAPEPYLKAMDMAGVAPWQSLVFENALLGVESGHKAKAFTIGINTGPIPASELADAGADIVFDSMTQCASCFGELFDHIKNSHF